jgi:hypothetical protein
VLVLLHLQSMHSQEWLCYWTFSAACEAATHKHAEHYDSAFCANAW